MKKHSTDFNTYTLTDYVDDPGFVSWILNPTEELNMYWDRVQKDYPNQKRQIQEAKKLVRSLRFTPEFMEAQEKEQLWQRIEVATTVVRKTRVLPLWLRGAAAAMLTGILLSIGFYFYRNGQTSIHTDFAQVKTVTLPDGSEITLNANSSLHYARNWDKEKNREVWIKGEAFFKVNHLHKSGNITAGQRFIVHSQKLNIEVLGTSFNVNNRRGNENVALVTGKISLRLNPEKINADHDLGKVPAMIMKPGDIFRYEEAQHKLSMVSGNTTNYSSWRNNELNFDNTPVADIFQYIEDVYGYQAVVKDPSILKKKLSGKLRVKDENNLFNALSAALNISIVKNTGTRQLIVKY